MYRLGAQRSIWRPTAKVLRRIPNRPFSDANPEPPTSATESREAWLFIDSVFPIQLGRWDFRHYIGIFREESLLTALRSRLSAVTSHNFRILSLEPHRKDGGVFVCFSYTPTPDKSNDEILESIEDHLREEAVKHGGLPSWIGVGGGSVWLVKGTPWREDMHRFASPILKIAFEGPDVHEQSLYTVFRPCGRIQDITNPNPVPPGSPRFSTITFQRLRSATIARNVLHGLQLSSTTTAPNVGGTTLTRLRTAYQPPIHVHAIRDWISSHPRIVLPVLVFLLGTLTYTIFDPIRSVMVQGKMLDWFDYREFTVYKWLRTQTYNRLNMSLWVQNDTSSPAEDVWKDRKDADEALRRYLKEPPSTVAFIHGPQDSGKSKLLHSVLTEMHRKTLIIDCKDIPKASSDTELVLELARQTGYWPVFTFLNSVNTLIDLASVGLIGQKTGLSSSLTDQLLEVLGVVKTGLQGVSTSLRASMERVTRRAEREEKEKIDEEWRRERMKKGLWHDGRLDCVAGNGVMCELGIGDEVMGEWDEDSSVVGSRSENGSKGEGLSGGENEENKESAVRKQRSLEDLKAVAALPIVVIKNFASKSGSGHEELFGVLAKWAAALAENQIAHVIVTSDNRENAKRLAKALPSKPLHAIALYDADAVSALSFVKQRLGDAGVNLEYTHEQTECVERLGGRASDLETLINRVQSGQAVEDVVEDIINQTVPELRKNAFGDDVDDAKNLPWSQEQAWTVLKALSKQDEIPFHDILLNFPFKGDETPLRSMEYADLITIGIHNGRPSVIRPGKPVYRYAFERLVNDPIFQAAQDIAFNEKVIASAESTVSACEHELNTLKEIVGIEPRHWLGGRTASSARAVYLFEKMLAAETKIEALERKNGEMRKALAKGE